MNQGDLKMNTVAMGGKNLDVVAMLIQSNRRFSDSLERWHKKGVEQAQDAVIQASIRTFKI
ncbi:MAG: hypothetical protein JKY89_13250 [Immundisolibacteraceae bacterium]|nr:hypothetical protein [Immundisolibacteraceae bacterium]